MSKIKVAVIGCGTIANSAHIPAYLKCEDVELKYFCDILPERAKQAVEKYQCGTAITDYKKALRDPEIQAVSVCTPNKVHPVIAIAALKAGKNVLCEKPAARTFAEAIKMQTVQQETGKVLNIGVVNRFNGAVKAIKKMIDNGELGEIYHVYASFRKQRSIPGLGGAFTTKEIAGGGVLIDWGVHFLDVVMYCCGDPIPKTASGKAYSILGKDMEHYVYDYMWSEQTKDLNGTYDVDDFITGFIRTDGPTISLNGAWAQNIGHDEMFIDFLGSKGGIRLNYGKEFEFFTTKDGKLFSEKPAFDGANMFDTEIASFIRCIKTGEKLPSHIDTVIITAKMMQALYDSAQKGKEITLKSN